MDCGSQTHRCATRHRASTRRPCSYLGVLARDYTIRIGKGPIKILVASNIDAAPSSQTYAKGSPVRQGRNVLDREDERHRSSERRIGPRWLDQVL